MPRLSGLDALKHIGAEGRIVNIGPNWDVSQ